MLRGGIFKRYGSRIRIAGLDRAVTLCEGDTPLISTPRLASQIAPGCELLVKYEGLNPTGSFKDRGMAAAVTDARADGFETLICASTGNTAASAAAYAARAGMNCFVLVSAGNVALGKLAGAISYGAKVITIRGSFDEGLRLVREAAERHPISLVNSVNPARLEGQQTAAWEICDEIGVPDWLCLPVGNAGNITAYWMGFGRWPNDGAAGSGPKLLGAQAAGAAPIVLRRVVDDPQTRASAIKIGNPARWAQADEALEKSGGFAISVTDDEIMEAYRMVARLEGLFCEPASAAGLAGLKKAVREKRLNPQGLRIVAVLTGHGLKDPEAALDGAHLSDPVAASLEDVIAAMGLD